MQLQASAHVLAHARSCHWSSSTPLPPPLSLHRHRSARAACARTHSIRLDRSKEGISYLTKSQLKGRLSGLEVAQFLATSTSCQAPDLLEGSMAQAAQQYMALQQRTSDNPPAPQQHAHFVLEPPAPPDCAATDGQASSRPQQSHGQLVGSSSDEALVGKIEKGVYRSSALMTAFADSTDLYGLSSTSNSTDQGTSTTAPSWLERIKPVPGPHTKSLIGLARASSDESLVATIHEVCVHPAFRGQGIGCRLLRLLLRQITDKGISDIGAVVPAEVQGFYTALGFEQDREQSTVMKIGNWPQRGTQSVTQSGVRPQHVGVGDSLPSSHASQPYGRPVPKLSPRAEEVVIGVLQQKLLAKLGPPQSRLELTE